MSIKVELLDDFKKTNFLNFLGFFFFIQLTFIFVHQTNATRENVKSSLEGDYKA